MRLGIRPLLIGGMALVIGSLMAVTTYVDVQRQRDTEHEDLEARGVLLSNSLNSVLAAPIRERDLERVADVASAIWAQPDVSFVKIFDGNGVQLVGPGEDQFPRGVQDRSVLDAVADLHSRWHWTEGELEFTAPVTGGAAIVGAVQFGFSAARIDDEIESLTLNRIWQTLALMGAGVALSILVASYISEPLRVLVRATNSFARGDLSTRVDELHGHETNELGKAFNRMASELEDKVQALEESRTRIVSTQENTRRDIATHLHGPVQGRLLALRGQLEVIGKSAGLDPGVARELQSVVENLGLVIQEEISTLSRRLFPAILRRGLSPSLYSLGDQFQSIGDVEVRIEDSLQAGERQTPGYIPEQTRLSAYRIAEEALTNVAKHAAATHVVIELGIAADGWLELRITDDGTGIPSEVTPGLGLSLMSDYAQTAGGECTVAPAPGKGAVVTARLPLA